MKKIILLIVIISIFFVGTVSYTLDWSSLYAQPGTNLSYQKWNLLLTQISDVYNRLKKLKPIDSKALLYGYCEGRVFNYSDLAYSTPSDKILSPAYLTSGKTCGCNTGYTRKVLGCDAIDTGGPYPIYYGCIKN